MTTQRDTRVFYRDIKPYEAPARLEELHGPASGRLALPHHVYWGPAESIDIDTLGGLMKAYQAVIAEGSASDQAELLNRGRLLASWSELMLPRRVRELWENRFPELTRAA